MNQANPTSKTEIQKLPKEMKYPKYLVLITCTLLLGSYLVLQRTGLLSPIRILPPLGKGKTLTLLESELIKNYKTTPASQIKKTTYTTQHISLTDIAQGDILEVTFDYDTLPSKLTQDIPIALVSVFQGNLKANKYYLKSQLRSKRNFKLPLDINLDKYIQLKIELTGTAPLNLYSLSFTINSPKN